MQCLATLSRITGNKGHWTKPLRGRRLNRRPVEGAHLVRRRRTRRELVRFRRSWDLLVSLLCYPCSMSRWRMNSLTACGCVNGSKWPAPVTTTSGRVYLTGSVRSADPWIWKTRPPFVLALGCQVRAAQLAQRRNVDCGLDKRFNRPTVSPGRHGVSDRATPAATRPKPVGPSIATGRIARKRQGSSRSDRALAMKKHASAWRWAAISSATIPPNEAPPMKLSPPGVMGWARR
jgi:hypothetical protein